MDVSFLRNLAFIFHSLTASHSFHFVNKFTDEHCQPQRVKQPCSISAISHCSEVTYMNLIYFLGKLCWVCVSNWGKKRAFDDQIYKIIWIQSAWHVRNHIVKYYKTSCLWIGLLVLIKACVNWGNKVSWFSVLANQSSCLEADRFISPCI